VADDSGRTYVMLERTGQGGKGSEGGAVRRRTRCLKELVMVA
jgi:hypothetical protein